MKHTCTHLLQHIGAILTFAMVAIVDDEAAEQHVDEGREAEHVLLVGIGNDHDRHSC